MRTLAARSLQSRHVVLIGAFIGLVQAASPLAFPWIEPATVYAVGLVLIASVYLGFAVADGRPIVLVVEIVITTLFVILSGVALAGAAWLLVVGLIGHGLKDLWQERTQFVVNTKWWPPFCVAVDFVAAAVIAVEIVAGTNLHAPGV
jgi:hypothetical protein